MDLQLRRKPAQVTGSSSGLGAVMAQRLSAQGASVVAHGRDEARAAAVAKTIREAGGEAAVVAVGDLATDEGADAVAAAALAGSPVDVLVTTPAATAPP
jgi:short-subunit dehydrogenase